MLGKAFLPYLEGLNSTQLHLVTIYANRILQSKYDIPDAAKHWILERIRESWRKNKSDLKRDHYNPWENDEIQLKKRPESVPECQFKELLVYWKSEKFQKMSETDKENWKKLMNPHTIEKKSFSTNWYAQIKEIETQLGSNEQSVDAFSAVMRAEHLGHVRLLGGGVKKTSLKRLNDRFGPTLNATNDVVPQMQERMRKIEDQIEEQKRTIRQEVVADPKILAALSIPSPMGSTSTLAATERNNQNRKGDHDVEDSGNEIDELDLT
ncbi:hypothetical protein P3S68_004284 [Capsicum galapagoense]